MADTPNNHTPEILHCIECGATITPEEWANGGYCDICQWEMDMDASDAWDDDDDD